MANEHGEVSGDPRENMVVMKAHLGQVVIAMTSQVVALSPGRALALAVELEREAHSAEIEATAQRRLKQAEHVSEREQLGHGDD